MTSKADIFGVLLAQRAYAGARRVNLSAAPGVPRRAVDQHRKLTPTSPRLQPLLDNINRPTTSISIPSV